MTHFPLIVIVLSLLIVTEPVDSLSCTKSDGGENEEVITCATSCSTLTSYGDTNLGYTVKGCGEDGPDGCTITDRGDCCFYAGSRECLCRTDLCNKNVSSCGSLDEKNCTNSLNLPSPCPPPQPCSSE